MFVLFVSLRASLNFANLLFAAVVVFIAADIHFSSVSHHHPLSTHISNLDSIDKTLIKPDFIPFPRFLFCSVGNVGNVQFLFVVCHIIYDFLYLLCTPENKKCVIRVWH